MSARRPQFDDQKGWSESRGTRSKVFSDGAASLRLVELTPETEHPEWCETGHAGWVVEGSLEIEFGDGVLHYEAGDGIVIAPGAARRHRPRARSERVRLALVDY